MKNNVTSLNRVPLEKAKLSIAYYKQRAASNQITGSKQIKAFLVKKEDVLEALGVASVPESTFDYFRVYIGMDHERPGEALFKLFLTPVVDVTESNTAGRDIILSGIVDENGEGEETRYVLDFNLPCPNTCDTASELYLAGERI